MINKKGVYKCQECGAIVESLWNGDETLSCCGKEMKELVANTTDAAKEKHVPVIERNGKRVTVKVGEVPHPMTDQHYILFVELMAGDEVLRHDFKKGDQKAEVTFMIEDENAQLTAREFCNLHGFWANK